MLHYFEHVFIVTHWVADEGSGEVSILELNTLSLGTLQALR
jgi:hypothetical protein